MAPSETARDWISLTFSPNSVTHAAVSLNTSTIYTISTDIKTNSKTDVVSARTGSLVATIERNEIFPDTVKFTGKNNGKKTRVSRWLVSGKLPDNFPVTFMETGLGRCTWKSDATNRLALFAPDDTECKAPIAYLQSESTQRVSLFLSPKLFNGVPYLDLHDAQTTPAILDELVVAVIYLEGKLRGRDKPFSTAAGVAQEIQIGAAFGN